MSESIPKKIHQAFITPRSTNPDAQRREFILNTLVIGLLLTSFAGVVAGIVNVLYRRSLDELTLIAPTIIFFALIGFCLYVSRRGHYRAVAMLLVGALLTVAVYLQISWSYMLPNVSVCYILAILVSGVLFEAKSALWISAVSVGLLSTIGLAQVMDRLQPYTGWLNHPLDAVDVVGGALVFAIVGLVTWLANREIDRSLERARSSERDLAIERDSLEIKVVERTRELKAAQMTRIIELQRLSEYGRLGMSLLHDVASPLTAASLDIEQLQQSPEPKLIKQISSSVHYIERYVQAARKQLRAESAVAKFNIYEELEQVVSIIQHRAREAGVHIEIHRSPSLTLTGDPVKFNQLIANLLINAIEAYADSPRSKRPIRISWRKIGRSVECTIQDWGRGIPRALRSQIFEPFFSTKNHSQHNMGIGLSMVKRYVEKEFNGSISVYSNSRQGTRFVVTFNKDNHASSHHSKRPQIPSPRTPARR